MREVVYQKKESFNEIYSLLKRMRIEFEKKDETTLLNYFKEIDKDGNGKICFEEFNQVMKKFKLTSPEVDVIRYKNISSSQSVCIKYCFEKSIYYMLEKPFIIHLTNHLLYTSHCSTSSTNARRTLSSMKNFRTCCSRTSWFNRILWTQFKHI